MAAAQEVLSVAEQIKQLDDARKLVLGDVSYYPTVVQGMLNILAPSSPLEIRRWGTDFLAEAFAAPTLPSKDKETLSLLVLEVLKSLLEAPGQDAYILRSAIQAAASIYPLALRWIVNNSYDSPTWERMTAIKSRIMRIWDTASPAIRICCLKFAQRVVLAQTHAHGVENRRDGVEISLSIVPPGHQLLDPRQLEAEATGLLDRLLGVLQENSSDALLVSAVVNTLAVLVRTRPATANRIVGTMLNFDPFKLANSPMTPRNRVQLRTMEKTVRMFLHYLAKRDPHNPATPRIHQHLERHMRRRAEIFDENASRKRALVEQQAAAYNDVKRQRLAAEAPVVQPVIKPLAPGQNSLAAIFTLTSNPDLQSFNASMVPVELAAKISVSTLARIDPQILSRAVNGIRERLANFEAAAAQPVALNPETVPLGVEEDDDDEYEPDFYAAEDTEQILNKLDSSPAEMTLAKVDTASLALGAFKLPPPRTMTTELVEKAGQSTITRVFSVVPTLEEQPAKKTRAGMNRLAAAPRDRDSWITVITRLATRSTPQDPLSNVKVEDNIDQAIDKGALLSDTVREALYKYILGDFRKRIETAVSWLNEEWYCDKVQAMYQTNGARTYYDKWALRLVDGFFPYLHPQDKVLTRFLSEIPAVNAAILARVRTLCRDPSMVQLALQSLLYLIMFRPPARELVLNAMQDIWIEFEDARPMASKILTKWRPAFISSQTSAISAPAGEVQQAIAT